MATWRIWSVSVKKRLSYCCCTMFSKCRMSIKLCDSFFFHDFIGAWVSHKFVANDVILERINATEKIEI